MSRPRTWLVAAAIIAAAYLASRLAGLAIHTSILSGTLPDAASGLVPSAALGVLHVLLHFGFVVLAPILVLAAALQWALASWSSSHCSSAVLAMRKVIVPPRRKARRAA